MAESTQEEFGKPGKPTEAIKPMLGGKTEGVTEESEGKKWADIIRHKGFGNLHGVFSPKWQFELNGSMINLVKENTGFQTAGAFGIRHDHRVDQEPILAEAYNRIYNSIQPDHPKLRDPSNFFMIANYRGDKVNKHILFSYYSHPDPRFDVNRGVAPLQFAFVLPLTEGEELEKRIYKNFDLIEDIFNNVYPGLTGEQGMERLIVDKVRGITGFNSNAPPFFSSIDFPFSHPVGENPWNFSKSY